MMSESQVLAEEQPLGAILTIITVGLLIGLCGVLAEIGIDGIPQTPRSRAKYMWRCRVLNEERPLYSLKAFRALGGELDNMDMPHRGRYYVMLSFRDWYKLRNEKYKAIARHNREEWEKRIMRTRIEIAKYCKESGKKTE